MKKIGIIIIEDNKLLRDGISAMVKKQKDIRVVAALGDKIKVHDKIRDLKPDVMLLDLGLVNQNSLDLVKYLKKKFPKLKMIVMDLLPIQSDMIQFIEEGVSGFILKDATTEDFLNTIRSVAKGDKIFPSQLHGSLFSEIVDNAVKELMDSKLIESIRMTENEKRIVELISKGFTDKEIAKKLQLSVSIVRGHIDNILEKMSLSTRVQIAVYRNSGGDAFESVKPRKVKMLKEKRIRLIKLNKLNGTYNGNV
jgi:DNA-binding NarL/FixJ family response regulator